MAYFLFVEESGQDRRESPQEVLAGVAVEDRDLWNLVRAVQDAEVRLLGCRYTADRGELKAKRLLKRKVFRLAQQLPAIDPEERTRLARHCLEEGATAGRRELTALAQAKLAYVREIFDLCARFHCRAFAAIVRRDAPVPPPDDHLRRDYAFLFERFFYFLEDQDRAAAGIVVFDEVDLSHSHRLVRQMGDYFTKTVKGRQRAGQIIPEPFFVHSDLTTGVQIADLVAYLVSWGFRRHGGGPEGLRAELEELAERVRGLEFRTQRPVGKNPRRTITSWVWLTDLRPREQREA